MIKRLAQEHDCIKAINLLKNYGQHTAVYCGIKYSEGDYLITMDDDLQNPPSEIHKLLDKIEEGYDLVFAQFRQKKHAAYRKLGTQIIKYLNKKIFNKPDHIILSNFRIFKKSVAERILNYQTNYPYIPGLLLLFAGNMTNVLTEHHSRFDGKSNYSLYKIIKLVSRLLINYSSFPMKVLTVIGFFCAIMCFLIGIVIFLKATLSSSSVPGWSSIAIMVSLLNGLLIIMVGTLGVYISRILRQVSDSQSFYVKEEAV